MLILLKYWADSWPDNKPINVEAHFSGEIPVWPNMARQQVSQFLEQQPLPDTFSGTPILLLGDRLVWRVPVCLRVPGLEPEAEVIQLGMVDVDALKNTLEVPSPDQIATMRQRAKALTAHFG